MNLKLKFCFALILLTTFALTADGQRVKPPQNVLEYFTALPTKYLGLAADAKDRKKIIEIEDLENGYLRLSGDLWEGWGEAALFKNADGTKTFAIQTVSCGPVCETESLFFLRYKNGKWIDATKDILPDVSEAELLRVLQCFNPEAKDSVTAYYELPRYGTTVKLTDNTDAEDNLLYEFVWNGTKFSPRAKRDKACRNQ